MKVSYIMYLQVINENEKLKSQNKTMQTNLEQLQGLKEVCLKLYFMHKVKPVL